ncbi:MAG: nuclease domain-containing protein [Vicinamibacterales bacterium]
MTGTSHAVPHLRWRRSEAPDDWALLSAAPVTNQGFTENGCYLIELPSSEWSFRVDDEPLASETGHGHWRSWRPGFYAGEVTAELCNPNGRPVATYLLDVAPDPSKSGRELFAQMLAEIWRDDPSLLLGTEPARTPIGALGENEDPWMALSRLRRHGPSFLRALDAIRVRPRRVLRPRRASSLLHHVRRADRRTAVSVMRGAAAGLLLEGVDTPATPSALTRVDVPFTEETFDNAANRALLAITQAVLRRTLRLGTVLQAATEADREEDTRTSMAARWPVRRAFLQEFEEALRLALRRAPFPDVREASISAAGLNAISADPVYARAWGLAWRAMRHGFEGDPATERTWISPSFQVYEAWCFVRLARLLEEVAPEWHWSPGKADSRRWIGHTQSRRAEFKYQRAFPAHGEPQSGYWSISRYRIPDMVLTVESPEERRFLVFDAKYRTSRANVLDAMASAHIYQDSLRFADQRPWASLLLVPAAGGAPHLESTTFLDAHRVGVCEFSPESSDVVKRLISRFLSDQSLG